MRGPPSGQAKLPQGLHTKCSPTHLALRPKVGLLPAPGPSWRFFSSAVLFRGRMPVQKSAKPSPAAKPADRKPLQTTSQSAGKAQLKVVKSDVKQAAAK